MSLLPRLPEIACPGPNMPYLTYYPVQKVLHGIDITIQSHPDVRSVFRGWQSTPQTPCEYWAARLLPPAQPNTHPPKPPLCRNFPVSEKHCWYYQTNSDCH